MKQIIQKKTIIILVIFSTLFVTACDDWLELIPPDGLVRDEYWQTKEDVKATLMGAYQQFAKLDATLFLVGELRGDLIVGDANTSDDHLNIMEANIFPDNSLCNWADFYTIIHYCNSVLKYAPIVYDIDNTFSEYQLRGFEAEALYLRSLAYFYLVRVFKDVPLVLEASESDDTDFFLPVTSSEEILIQIKQDLLSARTGVTEDYGSIQENKEGQRWQRSIVCLPIYHFGTLNTKSVFRMSKQLKTLGSSWFLVEIGLLFSTLGTPWRVYLKFSLTLPWIRTIHFIT